MKNNDDIINCYGTLVTHVSNNGRVIVKNCDNECCTFREACVSASREKLEEIEFQKQTVPLEDRISRIEYIFESTPVKSRVEAVLADMGVSEDQADVLRETIEILSLLYFRLPRIFDAAMRRIYKKENLSDIAKMRGVSRQAVSKGGLADLAGIKNPLAFLPPDLEGIELAVYDCLFVRKKTIRQAAVELKISNAAVFRLKQKISSKLNENGTRKRKKK